jgi:hypothetical protein
VNEDRLLTALERQNLDPGVKFFETEEEMREYAAELRLVHEAVLKAVAEALGGEEDVEDISDLDNYDDLLEGET